MFEFPAVRTGARSRLRDHAVVARSGRSDERGPPTGRAKARVLSVSHTRRREKQLWRCCRQWVGSRLWTAVLVPGSALSRPPQKAQPQILPKAAEDLLMYDRSPADS